MFANFVYGLAPYNNTVVASGAYVNSSATALIPFLATFTPCPTVTCPADFDGNSTVNVSDIFAFLRAWFAHSASADIDGNSVVNVSDIFAFLRHWFAHC
ncbi:MAG TPA: GC-type dockerin domain-anchored protein, partial [Polyangiaceae bacterium]|nr:GC-type dockerin domain-anchored protein [Polyangiaceae bacterium]